MTGGGTLDAATKLSLEKDDTGGYDRTIHSQEAMGDQLVTIAASIGAGTDLGIDFSGDGGVERGAAKTFSVGLTDKSAGGGPIASANIDISSGTASLEKSTGAGYSAAGITQPTITKQDGFIRVTVAPFINGEWAAGNSYRLTLDDCTATISGDIIPVTPHDWSGVIHETGDLDADIETIKTDLTLIKQKDTAPAYDADLHSNEAIREAGDSGFTDQDGKITAIKVETDAQAARPKLLDTASISAVNITSETEITSGSQEFTATRDGEVELEFLGRSLVNLVADYSIRTELTRGGVIFDLGTSVIQKRVNSQAFIAKVRMILVDADIIDSYITSSEAGDTSVVVQMRVTELL